MWDIIYKGSAVASLVSLAVSLLALRRVNALTRRLIEIRLLDRMLVSFKGYLMDLRVLTTPSAHMNQPVLRTIHRVRASATVLADGGPGRIPAAARRLLREIALYRTLERVCRWLQISIGQRYFCRQVYNAVMRFEVDLATAKEHAHDRPVV